MRQLELMIIPVRLRLGEGREASDVRWSQLPAEKRAEVIELLAKALRAKLDGNAAGEAADE